MKKLTALLLLAVLVVAGTVGTAAATEKVINVNLKNEVFCFGEIQPVIRNGRTLVPLQCGVFEKFSATTEYDHIYKEVVIRTNSHILTLYTDQLIIYNKGEAYYELDVSAEYINGQVYVPLRGFMEAMGKKVEYCGKTNTALVW
jgi:hypothetical protein